MVVQANEDWINNFVIVDEDELEDELKRQTILNHESGIDKNPMFYADLGSKACLEVNKRYGE